MRHGPGSTPFVAAAAAVTIFILCNKVYSPTYDVWLVVFFVLLPVSRRLWVTFCAVDLAVCLTVYGYFHGVDSRAFVHAVLPWLVLAPHRRARLVPRHREPRAPSEAEAVDVDDLHKIPTAPRLSLERRYVA